jgi:hypothetical protein
VVPNVSDIPTAFAFKIKLKMETAGSCKTLGHLVTELHSVTAQKAVMFYARD